MGRKSKESPNKKNISKKKSDSSRISEIMKENNKIKKKFFLKNSPFICRSSLSVVTSAEAFKGLGPPVKQKREQNTFVQNYLSFTKAQFIQIRTKRQNV